MKCSVGPLKFRCSVRPVMATWKPHGRFGLVFHLEAELGNYELELSNGSLQPWNHLKIHRHKFSTHVVAGRFSCTYGTPGLEPITVCAECGEATTTKSAGDESWTYCEGCQQVEGQTMEITLKEYEER